MSGPAQAPAPTRVAVGDASQVPLARSLAARAARAGGLGRATEDAVALAATELAENLHRHAFGGDLLVVPSGAGPTGELTLLAVDRGPGVERFDRCLVDGYSTIGTLGTGLGAVRRLASRFDAVSEPGHGTVVLAGFGPAPHDRAFDVAAVGFAIEPETVNGDGWTAVRRGSRLVVLVADGLGHGPDAHAASSAAAAQLASLADRPPDVALAEISARLRATRGAAVTLASVDLDSVRQGGTVHSAGLGNVSLLVAEPGGHSRRVITSHGTAGTRTGAVHEVTTPFPAGGVLVLHTDGLTSRWDLEGRPELLRHSAAVIAAALWRDHARGHDDSLVVVLRAGAHPDHHDGHARAPR